MSDLSPAPWKVDNDGYIVSSNDEDVAEVLGANGDTAVIRANALVLSSAPELLEALELAASYIGKFTCPGGIVNDEALRVYKAVTEPIKKARGEA